MAMAVEIAIAARGFGRGMVGCATAVDPFDPDRACCIAKTPAGTGSSDWLRRFPCLEIPDWRAAVFVFGGHLCLPGKSYGMEFCRSDGTEFAFATALAPAADWETRFGAAAGGRADFSDSGTGRTRSDVGLCPI